MKLFLAFNRDLSSYTGSEKFKALLVTPCHHDPSFVRPGLPSYLTENLERGRMNSRQRSWCTLANVWLVIKSVVLILFFYTFSITLTFYNKHILTTFRFPLSITILHLVVKFCIAGALRTLIELRTKEKRITLDWDLYWRKLAPTGISSSLDIGFSNWSFEFITVSLYTMTKSSAIIFILVFSILFKLEKKRPSLILVVLFISMGLFLFTYQSTQFVMEGFLLVLLASFLSGVRWTLAQIVTQKHEIGLSNPVDMIYHVQPWMIAALLPLAVYFEGIHIATTDQVFGFHDSRVLASNSVLLLAGAGIAFLLESSEYLLISTTSGLTLCVAGIFKEICTLYLAAVINGDTMSPVNFLGMAVCLCGIGLHVCLKAYHMRQQPKLPLDGEDEAFLMEDMDNSICDCSDGSHQHRS